MSDSVQRLFDTPDILSARDALRNEWMTWVAAPAGWLAAERVLAPIPRPVLRRSLWPRPADPLAEVRRHISEPVVFVLSGLAMLTPAALRSALMEVSEIRGALSRGGAWVVVRSELPMSHLMARARREPDERTDYEVDYVVAGGRLPQEHLAQRIVPGTLPINIEGPLAGHPRLVLRAFDQLRNGVPVHALQERLVELALGTATSAAESIRATTPTALEALGLDAYSLSDDERDALLRWDLLRSGVFEGRGHAELGPGPSALLDAVRRLA